MAAILVDYENVNGSNGLKGADALCADYTEVETMPKLSFKYREYQGFLLKISA